MCVYTFFRATHIDLPWWPSRGPQTKGVLHKSHAWPNKLNERFNLCAICARLLSISHQPASARRRIYSKWALWGRFKLNGSVYMILKQTLFKWPNTQMYRIIRGEKCVCSLLCICLDYFAGYPPLCGLDKNSVAIHPKKRSATPLAQSVGRVARGSVRSLKWTDLVCI